MSLTICRSLMLGVALAGVLAASVHAKAAVSDAAPPTITLSHCSWNHPGFNPFMGDIVRAVDRYDDIPPAVRARLKQRIAKREYDDLVSIRRDSIRGKADYSAAITDMHFGAHQVCRSVTRTEWTSKMEERGLVYCEQGHCILIPTVCRNVSRIVRAGGGAAPPVAAAPAGGETLPPLEFDPPGAGIPIAGAPDPAGFGGSADSAAAPGSFAAEASSSTGWMAFGPGPGSPLIVPLPAPRDSTSHKIASSSTPDHASDQGNALGGDPHTGQVPGNPAPISPVPEPQTWALLLAGLTLLVWRKRTRGINAATAPDNAR